MDVVFDTSVSFENRFKKILAFQLSQNSIYRTFSDYFGISESKNIAADQIPLLPIRAFKDSKLIVDNKTPQLIFQSSGTGTMKRSSHYVADSNIYRQAIEEQFYHHFPKDEFAILSYTPGYSDNPHSSLIWMINHLIQSDNYGLSRFLPLDKPLHKKDYYPILKSGKKVMLFGAAFGLLDLIEMKSDILPENSVIVETGGMKTYRREISKTELRKILSEGFQTPGKQIHSEYGMCELLSQCYAQGGEWFSTPHWMRVTIRKEEDPGKICKPGEEGIIGIIDLANIYSCPFILTDDRGVMDEQGRFRVLGRWSKSDLRGCNFLIDNEI